MNILGLQCHQKFKLTYYLTKFLHNVDNPVLKGLYKFQVDKPMKAKVISG